MSPRFLTPLLAAGALALAPAAASADTLVTPAPGAQNLASGGGWLVWAAPSGDSGFRLTVRAPDGTVTTPDIPAFDEAPDPAIGSDRFGADGRRLLAVYSRGGDIHALDLRKGTEEKVRGASSRRYEETAPGINFGRIVFVRSGGKRNGIHLLDRGKVRRVSSARPARLAFNGSRVAYAKGSRVILHRISGKGADSFARGDGRVIDVTLDRYRLSFLTPGGKVFQTNRFGGSGDVHEIRDVKQGTRTLSATTQSIALSSGYLRFYADAEGIHRIDERDIFDR